jgi:hypothetical protein
MEEKLRFAIAKAAVSFRHQEHEDHEDRQDGAKRRHNLGARLTDYSARRARLSGLGGLRGLGGLGV